MRTFLRILALALIVLGVAAALLGQDYGNRVGAPDLAQTFVWALVPFGLLLVAALWLARSAAALVVLVMLASLFAVTSDVSSHDELGLVFFMVPLTQSVLISGFLIVLIVRRWWVRRGEPRAV